MRSDSRGYMEKDFEKTRDIRLLKRFVPLIRKNIIIVIFSIVLMLLISLVEIFAPYVTKIAMDSFILPENEVDIHHRLSGAAMAGGVLFVLALVRFVFSFIQIMIMEYAGQRMMHDLRMEIFDHIQRLSVDFFTRNTVGRLSTRVTNDIQNMQELFTTIITFVMKDAFMLMGIIVMLCIMDIRLSLAVFLIIPLVVFSTWFFSRKSREVYRRLRVNVAEINSTFSECIGGIKIIQLFNRERKMAEDFKLLNHENYLAGLSQVKLFGLFMPVIDVFGSITLAIVIFYGGGRVVSQALSLGTLVAFISYSKMFFRPIRDLSEKHNILQNALSSGERIVQILDEKEPPDTGTRNIEAIHSLTLKNVFFSYPGGEPVLHNVSFHIDAGKSLAVIGPTGSGKTSLINLIVGFYKPAKGDILINGESMENFTIRSIRSRVALVTQDPYLFSGTIRDNIVPPERKLSKKELDEIIRLSHAASVIDHLPRGIDTVISQGGTSLSSGERQLISIARAFAHKPDLIIFDEATSYVDTQSEEKIRIAAATLKENRTSITIAHRLRSAMTADQIIVLKDGRVFEAGNHEELMDKKGFYFAFHDISR